MPSEKSNSFRLSDWMSWPVAVLVILLFALGQTCGAHHLPPYDGDSVFFLPIAISYAAGAGLINPLWHPVHVYDPAHPAILTWHGFLYPMLLGKFAPSPTYDGIGHVHFVIGLLDQIISPLIVFRIVTLGGLTGFARNVVAIATIFGLCGIGTGAGRPEFLIAILADIGVAACLLVNLEWLWIIFGIIIGLAMAASPVPAVILSQIVGIYVCVRLPLKQAVLFLVKAGVLALAVFGLCFSAYPFTLTAWIHGMQLHASVAVAISQTDYAALFRNPALMILLLVLLLLIAMGLYFLVWEPKTIRFRLGAVACSLMVIGSIYYFWLRDLDREYNVTAFGFIIVLALTSATIHLARVWNKKSPVLGLALYAAVCGLFLFSSIGMFRFIAVLPAAIQTSQPYADARADFQKYRTGAASIQITQGLFTLTEDYTNIGLLQGDQQPTADILFIQQANRGSLEPPKYAGYTLVHDGFAKTAPHLFGIRVGHTPGGYNFAVYQRDNAASR